MNRSNSMANSITSTNSNSTTFLPYNSNNSSISPLIKLERLVFRLNSVLSIDTEDDEFVLKKHLKLLLQYQNEISKLKVGIDLNSNNLKKEEFEFENRLEWIENRIDLLNRSVKQLEEIFSKQEVEAEDVAGDTRDTCDIVVTDTIDCEIDKTEVESIHDILPPKPEKSTLFTQTTESTSTNNNTNTLTFSEDIQSVHDSLTNDLIATVQLIKRNNLHIQKIVKDDDAIINEASGLLATNSETMQKEGKNLKSYSKKAWVSFWKMICILMLVCFTFIFVYIFIKLT